MTPLTNAALCHAFVHFDSCNCITSQIVAAVSRMASTAQPPSSPAGSAGSFDYLQASAGPPLTRSCSQEAAAAPDLEIGRHPGQCSAPQTWPCHQSQAVRASSAEWTFALRQPQGGAAGQPAVLLRLAKTHDDDATVARHLGRMWAENGSPVGDPDIWEAKTRVRMLQQPGQASATARRWGCKHRS